jgi:hypothetical protein
MAKKKDDAAANVAPTAPAVHAAADANAPPADAAQSANYKLDVRRGLEVIIAFDFIAHDASGTEYHYSLSDFDEPPKLLQDILATMAKTWPRKDGFVFRFKALPTGVLWITEIIGG